MDVYIPIASRQTVEPEILEALEDHPSIENIWVHPTKEFYPRNDWRRYRAIANNTLEIFKHVIAKGDEFFVMCNSNKMLPYIPKIDEILDHLRKNPDCGCAAHTFKETKTDPVHVAIGFSIMRTEAIKNVKFSKNWTGGCNCLIFRKEMISAGWKVSYIGNSSKN